MYSVLLYVLIVMFVATLIRSAFGFGEALLAVPLLALRIPIEVAAPLAVLVSITVADVVVAHSLFERRMADIPYPVRHAGRPRCPDPGRRTSGEGGPGDHHCGFFGLLLARDYKAGVEERQPPVAGRLRVLWQHPRRGLWDERTATRGPRCEAPLVGAAFPRHAARLSSARESSSALEATGSLVSGCRL